MEKREESLVAKFHNQKEPDFDPETGKIYEVGGTGFKRYQDFLLKKEENKSSDTSKNQEGGLRFEKQIANLIMTIENVKLDPLYGSDEGQKELLKQKKDQAKKMIGGVLDDIVEYMDTIDSFYQVKMKREDTDQEIFLTEMKNAEDRRASKHNALISGLYSAIRFISHTFGNISDEAIDNYREEAEKNNRPFLEVMRVDLPENILCPDGMDINDRKAIAKWSATLYDSISNLKDRLSSKKR
jgi:hypothetical protein